ncbi:Valyl-tRNA synthetase [Halanaerobium saccharolyticum subsp. saccharolyticum DSM 6643]|uniref:Valine--tRNA ligase n=1 Tax=Halanaerobium saccharolyticum subsp. saccharolyticum DSM 6643 TaxID=1293054 RepID=M5DYW5_9FIRM|nr:valine--tRNA ligase [Halanaerobium saccharolyticum]CCU78462.1 Valyl-tRNA synthetase [Halanaerobium saccharolyticum subsp. saccharolyticum DSM 6643]
MENLEKTYDPAKSEDKWYDYWLENNYFAPREEIEDEKGTFSIVMPPPNITGQLHMGHALDNTLQDILTRWKRMQGYRSLWLPGTDHASIATEVKVVDKLRDEGIEKEDITRNEFLEKAWEWKEEYGTRITNQLKKMGSSCDWSRERFTLDEGCSDAVEEVFIKLYEEGLIYQGDYIVNWCPSCHTTLSDIEVEHQETEGKFYHYKYPYKDREGYITIATTRPETMLGDTAIAVHPSDERYKDLVGEKVIVPLVNREIEIIADEYVDSEFGTGMVKVTPAHDPNDFEIGRRNDLEIVEVIDEDAQMTEAAGEAYAGLDRYQARKKVIEDLEKEGLLVKIEDHMHNVGECYRCDTVIEPLISKQWFVKMQPLAEPAIEAVEESDINFVPDRFSKVYMNWMNNIRDWCISRQLWWGHRIPVYYCNDCDEVIVSKEEPESCPNCGSSNLRQDEDVLDTWFSSALWPFSTLGWPEDTDDLESFYPTDVLVTGRDIIFFWVARMIFMGLKFQDEKPFSDIYIHGLIRDAQGRKMSKSLGNGIDPLDIIDQFGADALRFTLITGNTPGNDMRFREERLEASRNFANKIWNASRFVLMNLEDFDLADVEEQDLKPTLADNWMQSRLNTVAGEIDEALEKYNFGEMSNSLYDFIWNEFCDWYIELLKARLYQDQDPQAKLTAQYYALNTLESLLRLLHPVMPFITEEIWQKLPGTEGTIMRAQYPAKEESSLDAEAEEKMELVMSVIKSVRNIRNEMKVNPGRRIKAIFAAPDAKIDILKEGREYIENLARIKELTIGSDDLDRPDKVSTSIVKEVEVILPLEGMIDLDKEIERMEKEIEEMEFEIKRAEGKLNNEGFVNNAPADLVEGEKEKLKEYKEKKEKLIERKKELAK